MPAIRAPQPAATPAAAQQPNNIDQLREALIPYIMQHLSGQQPQVPQYQPPQINPQQAFGLARNPQAAPQMMQYANAPAQAQYAQQQAAFEQAMSGQQHAVGAGVQLIGQDTRADAERARLDQQRQQNAIMDQLRAMGLQIQQQKADKGAAGKWHDTPTGPMWFDDTNPNAPGKPALGPGGTPIPPKADPQVQQSLNSLDLADTVIGNLRREYDTVQKNTQNPGGTVERMGMAGAAAIPGVRTAVGYMGQSGAAIRRHEADRQTLKLELQKPEVGSNRVLSGVLESILEQIPSVSEAPDVAHPMYDKLSALVAKTRQSLQALPQSWAATGGEVPANETPEQKKARIKAKYGLP